MQDSCSGPPPQHSTQAKKAPPLISVHSLLSSQACENAATAEAMSCILPTTLTASTRNGADDTSIHAKRHGNLSSTTGSPTNTTLAEPPYSSPLVNTNAYGTTSPNEHAMPGVASVHSRTSTSNMLPPPPALTHLQSPSSTIGGSIFLSTQSAAALRGHTTSRLHSL